MVLSSRRPGRNSKLQQIPLSEILRQGSFLFQAEGLALFRAKGSIPIGRGGHARAFFPICDEEMINDVIRVKSVCDSI